MRTTNISSLGAAGLIVVLVAGLNPPTLTAQGTPVPAALGTPVPAASVPVQPPTAYHITLEEAKERALMYNKKLELGRLNVKEKQIAAAAATRDYFPKILGIGAYMHFNEPLGTVVTTPGRTLGGQTFQLLPQGPGLQAPTITLPPHTVAANVLNQDSAVATIMMAQPITKLIGVNVLVELARADTEIASAKLDKGTRDLMTGVTQAYYGLVAGRRIQTTLNLQYGMLEKLLQLKPAPELRLAALQLRKGIVDTDKQVAELTDLMNQLIGLPPGTCLDLVEPALPPVPVSCADQAAELAVANSPQIREAQQDVRKANAGLRAAKMDYLPDVNIVGGVAGQTFADYFQHNFSYVGVTATYSFWDWGKRRQVKHQRETQIAMANHNVDVMIETVQLDARKAFLAYKQAQEELEIANETVKVRLDAEKDARDPAAVLTARSATAKAQLDQMQAEVNYRMAHSKLLATIGHP
jgi:outer membrane protein TolC